jgi:predicted molibdopterin-dependent oxidoreductase YjgC
MKARVSDRVAVGVVLVPHGWPGKSNANLLTDTRSRESIMGYPEMKGLQCSIRKLNEAAFKPERVRLSGDDFSHSEQDRRDAVRGLRPVEA